MIDLTKFNTSISAATTRENSLDALCDLAQESVGAKLFTIMTLDMNDMLARRAFTNDPINYPTSGTKPIEMTDWFETTCVRGDIFVANSLEDIAQVFPDHELIGSLGCGSVVNLPITLGGVLMATMNILHEEGYYTSQRVKTVEQDLLLPATAAMLAYTLY